MENKQINVSLPKPWFEQLERQARISSVEQDKTLSHLDLIRDAIKEKYNLKDNTDGTETVKI